MKPAVRRPQGPATDGLADRLADAPRLINGPASFIELLTEPLSRPSHFTTPGERRGARRAQTSELPRHIQSRERTGAGESRLVTVS